MSPTNTRNHSREAAYQAASAALQLELPEAVVEAIAARAAELVLATLADAREASPYMSIPEAAAFLRCKRQRIDDLLSARKLTRHKDGRRTLLLRAEVEALPQATTGPATTPPRATG